MTTKFTKPGKHFPPKISASVYENVKKGKVYEEKYEGMSMLRVEKVICEKSSECCASVSGSTEKENSTGSDLTSPLLSFSEIEVVSENKQQGVNIDNICEPGSSIPKENETGQNASKPDDQVNSKTVPSILETRLKTPLLETKKIDTEIHVLKIDRSKSSTKTKKIASDISVLEINLSKSSTKTKKIAPDISVLEINRSKSSTESKKNNTSTHIPEGNHSKSSTELSTKKSSNKDQRDGNQFHQCIMCKNIYSSKNDLTRHAQKEHHPNIVVNNLFCKLQCKLCGMYYATLTLLQAHVSAAHSEFAKKGNAARDLPILFDIEEAKPSKMKIKQKTFSGGDETIEINLDEDLGSSSRAGIPKLSTTPRTSNVNREEVSAEEIIRAEVIIDGKIHYQCQICDKHLYSRRTFVEHQRIHTGEKPFTCHVCGKQFRLASQINRHIQDVHERLKKHPCDICGIRFANTSALRDHKTRHTGVRSILCHLCGKSFKTKSALYMHSKFHVEKYSFPCPNCEKGFKTKEHLNIHLRTHTGERPYGCDYCGKHFYMSKTLQSHILIHTNSGKHKCSECGKTFPQERYLRNHERNHKKKADTGKSKPGSKDVYILGGPD